MKNTDRAPSWLNEKDSDERKWAVEYLLKRWHDPTPQKLGVYDYSSVSGLNMLIRKLESSVAGVKLIERLRNAIRQRRYRLSSGGRRTCSFTLPSETKNTLKRLAKSHRTTETALIQQMIENAALAAAEQKEAIRHEAAMAKVVRNSRKLAQELDSVRINETRKQLRHCVKQLARWEFFLKNEQPELSSEDEATATAMAERRMRAIHETIEASVAKYKILSPRSL
ncbi:hypothetical protein [Ectopseudomonas toyotomiensis]|uniref:Uncharacterized protein n=1 Tax=Ectopseudomonas toyotomiensis TaxID=554344 RepID=A0AA42LKW1_9GAMM|nr:hypothetical protein [Pseudomonas toyotomiensis]MBG0843496.1 hypothetical protein [Pseudomonas toyotomiensis]MDH0701310.1 hypothetical protein [Pseudomonas toyotomiensis]